MSDWLDREKQNGEATPPAEETTNAAETPKTVSDAPSYDKTTYTAPSYTAAPEETAGEWNSASAEQPAKENSAAGQPSAPTPTAPADWRTNSSYTGGSQPPSAPQQPTWSNSWYRSGSNGVPQNRAGNTGAGGNGTPPSYNGWTPIPPQPPKKKKTGGVVAALAVLGSVAVLALTVLVAFAVRDTIVRSPGVSDPDTSQSSTINDKAPTLHITDWADDDGGLSAPDVIEKNVDSTVVITIYQMRSATNYGFGGQTLREAGEGSGIIMTEDGYIITNWHVVTDEDTGKAYDQLDVTTHDGTLYENAKVIGADKATDLAIIKIDAAKLKKAEFGDSSKLVMGSRVLTLGNAGGLQWSASQGIISGLARDVYEDTGYSIKCLQTDAAINPGNSGGPLLNNQGQVVGVNSAKISADGYEGLGFSIPINEAKTVIDDLLKYGYVKGRVQLGITGYSVNSNGYKGFVIQTIGEDSMLSGTRARVGDLITAVNGVKIDGYGKLRTELAKHGVGDTVTLSLLRLDGRTGEETTFTVTCTLAEGKS